MKDTMELEIDFGQMLRVLKKRAKYIILLTMVCAVLGMAVAVTTPPKYRARTQMIVNAGIRRVVYEQGYPDAFSLEIFGETGVQLEKYVEEEA